MNREEVLNVILSYAEITPNSLAVVDNSDELTYSELRVAVERTSQLLQKNQLNDQIVVLRLPRGVKFTVMVLALTKMKITFIPQDIAQPLARLDAMVETAGAETLIELKDDHYTFSTVPNSSKNHSTAWAIYFTSGSTGNPKGVEIPFRTVANTVETQKEDYQLTTDDRVASFTPYSFVVSYYDLFSSLYSGSTLYVLGETERHDLNKLEKYLQDNKITFMNASTMIGEIIMRSMKLPSMRLLTLAGQRFPDVDIGQLNYQVMNVYGNTECACATICRVRPGETVTIGKPIRNMHALILDDQQRVLPHGSVGELFIYGVQVTNGYFLNEKATNKAFTSVSYQNQNIWGYRTGDYAKVLPNGELEYRGRRDSQYKINGVRIDLSEVGSVCREIIPNLKQCYLAVKANCIYCWVTSAKAIDESQILNALASRLPSVMIPIGIHQLTSFPLNINGKIDERRMIKEWSRQSLTKDNRHLSKSQRENEQFLINAWSEVLDADPDTINYQSNFRMLGATSLQIMELGVRILDERHKQLNFVDLYYHPVLADMAALLSQKNVFKAIYTFVPRTDDMGDKPALFVIHSGNTGSDVYRPLFTGIKRPSFPIYVIEPHNLLNPEDQIYGIENLAKYYLQMINKFLPESSKREINLMGWSYGGVVASEMCYQLEHETSLLHVNQLTVLDSSFYLSSEDLQRVRKREANGFYAKYFTETHIFEGMDKKNVTTERLIANNHQVCEDLFNYHSKQVNVATTFVRSMVEENPLTDEQIKLLFKHVTIKNVYDGHDYLFVHESSRSLIQDVLGLAAKVVKEK